MAKRKKSKGKSRGRSKAARSRAAKKGWVTRRSRGLSASLGLARHRSYGMTMPKKNMGEPLSPRMTKVLQRDSLLETYISKRKRLDELMAMGRYGYQLRQPKKAVAIARKNLRDWSIANNETLPKYFYESFDESL